MTNPYEDPRWSAYLDGELSASESARFDESLDELEREQLQTEMEFQSELADVLGARVECSRNAWKQAMTMVRQYDYAHESSFAKMRRYALRLTPLAVLAAGIILAVVFFTPEPQAAFLSLTDEDVAALEVKSQEYDSVAEVRDFLEQRAVQVALDPYNSLDADTTPYVLKGACENQYKGEPVMELLFKCMDGPAKVVIVRKSGSAASQIGRALADGTVKASRTVGDVIIAVVGQSAPRDLDRIVDDPFMHTETVEQPAEEQPQTQPATEEPTDTQVNEPEPIQVPFPTDEPESLV